jgi:hypothetical protein
MIAQTPEEFSDKLGSHSGPKMMPAAVKPGQVLSLVELIGGSGVRVNLSTIAKELEADLTVLPAVLDAGVMLGLVQSENKEIRLTPMGSNLLMTTDYKLRVLKDSLANIEPFSTALELAAKGGSVTSKQLVRVLREKGILWDQQSDSNYVAVNSLMINWSIFAGLFKYEKSKFLKLV